MSTKLVRQSELKTKDPATLAWIERGKSLAWQGKAAFIAGYKAASAKTKQHEVEQVLDELGEE